jgi:hypothetical protein
VSVNASKLKNPKYTRAEVRHDMFTAFRERTSRIQDVLAGRVRAREVVHAMDYNRLRSLGFKYVAYTNGELSDDLSFHEQWEVPKWFIGRLARRNQTSAFLTR